MIETCYACEGEASLVSEPREVQIGNRSVVVEGEFMRCADCGEAYFLPGQMQALQRTASDRIRSEEGLLTGQEIRAFRERLGLSQPQFETLLGTGEKTVVRWERGAVFQSSAADTLMRVLMKHPDALHDLALERGVHLDGSYFGEPVSAIGTASFEVPAKVTPLFRIVVGDMPHLGYDAAHDALSLSA